MRRGCGDGNRRLDCESALCALDKDPLVPPSSSNLHSFIATAAPRLQAAGLWLRLFVAAAAPAAHWRERRLPSYTY